MTIFEQHQKEKQEQFQVGMQHGELGTKRDIAKNLLLRNELSIETIAIVTHLTVAEIKALKATLETTKH